KDASAQLVLSSAAIRGYLTGCQREWQSLAKKLRDAAKAYAEVDEGGADAINGNGSAPGTTGLMDLSDPEQPGWTPPPPQEMPQRPPDQYYPVDQATIDVHGGNPTEYPVFVRDWDAFSRVLQQETYRFRPFTAWEGDARDTVEQNFE